MKPSWPEACSRSGVRGQRSERVRPNLQLPLASKEKAVNANHFAGFRSEARDGARDGDAFPWRSDGGPDSKMTGGAGRYGHNGSRLRTRSHHTGCWRATGCNADLNPVRPWHALPDSRAGPTKSRGKRIPRVLRERRTRTSEVGESQPGWGGAQKRRTEPCSNECRG